MCVLLLWMEEDRGLSSYLLLLSRLLLRITLWLRGTFWADVFCRPTWEVSSIKDEGALVSVRRSGAQCAGPAVTPPGGGERERPFAPSPGREPAAPAEPFGLGVSLWSPNPEIPHPPATRGPEGRLSFFFNVFLLFFVIFHFSIAVDIHYSC